MRQSRIPNWCTGVPTELEDFESHPRRSGFTMLAPETQQQTARDYNPTTQWARNRTVRFSGHSTVDEALVPPPLTLGQERYQKEHDNQPAGEAREMAWMRGHLNAASVFSRGQKPDTRAANEETEGAAGFRSVPLPGTEEANGEQILQLPRPPPATWQRSFQRASRRISLTPSEMPYPAALLYNSDTYATAEEVLGLRRHTRPPPVPPKDHANDTSTASDSVGPDAKALPTHKTNSKTEHEPQNGRTAWLHALAAVLVVFNCWGIPNAFGLFQAYYERDYLAPTTPSTIAWIGSTQLALVFGLGVPVGRLVDKGYFHVIFHSGTVLMILGLFMSSFCKHFWSLWLVQGLLTGLGMGSVFCSGIVALMTWFDERKIGVAMGLGAAGSCIGGIAYVLLARHFLVAKGFATTMRVIGAVAAATMIPPNIIFKMRIQRRRICSRRRSVILNSNKDSKSHITWRTFTEPAYLLAAAGLFLSFLGVYFGFVYMISYGSTVLHLSDTQATNLLVFMLIANLPGRFVPALISDKCIGPLNTIIPATILSGCVIGLWAATTRPTHGSLTVIACFYGFVSAGVQVLYAPTVYTFCLENTSVTTVEGTEDASQLAMDRMGVKAGGIFSCIGLACLIGTPIGGALINYRTTRNMDMPYLGAQAFAGACLVLGGCLLLASRVKKAGWLAQRA